MAPMRIVRAGIVRAASRAAHGARDGDPVRDIRELPLCQIPAHYRSYFSISRSTNHNNFLYQYLSHPLSRTSPSR